MLEYKQHKILRVLSIIVLWLTYCSPVLNAQEINGNGIDDDGDCNIDCDDLSFGLQPQEYTNGMYASFVVGQNDYTSNSPGCDQYSMDWPYDVALDPTTNKVFVSDLENNRILRFATYDDFIYANAPEAVFGQTNFTNNTSGCSSTKLNQPTGIFVDHFGSLWVTDWYNNRVLKYANASSKSMGAAADNV